MKPETNQIPICLELHAKSIVLLCQTDDILPQV